MRLALSAAPDPPSPNPYTLHSCLSPHHDPHPECRAVAMFSEPESKSVLLEADMPAWKDGGGEGGCLKSRPRLGGRRDDGSLPIQSLTLGGS